MAHNRALRERGRTMGVVRGRMIMALVPTLLDRTPMRVLRLRGGRTATTELDTRPAARLVLGNGRHAARYEIPGEGLTIGRAAENRLVIDAPQVSRYHAQICFDDGQYLIFDRNSRNGVYVNGRQVMMPTPLRDGDTVTLARTLNLALVFRCEQR